MVLKWFVLFWLQILPLKDGTFASSLEYLQTYESPTTDRIWQLILCDFQGQARANNIDRLCWLGQYFWNIDLLWKKFNFFEVSMLWGSPDHMKKPFIDSLAKSSSWGPRQQLVLISRHTYESVSIRFQCLIVK